MSRPPVELTLIPIAAILLLLTGFSKPAQPALDDISSVAVLRFWLSRERSHTSSRRMRRTRVQQSNVSAQSELRADGQARLSGRAHRIVRHRRRALRFTRFGVVSAAYRSTAPPAQA